MVAFDEPIVTACGRADPVREAAFYCVIDEKIYYSAEFRTLIENQIGDFRLGDRRRARVGTPHSSQAWFDLGVVPDRAGEVAPIEFEQQADCLAGAYAIDAELSGWLDPGDVDEALAITEISGDPPGPPGTIRVPTGPATCGSTPSSLDTTPGSPAAISTFRRPAQRPETRDGKTASRQVQFNRSSSVSVESNKRSPTISGNQLSPSRRLADSSGGCHGTRDLRARTLPRWAPVRHFSMRRRSVTSVPRSPPSSAEPASVIASAPGSESRSRQAVAALIGSTRSCALSSMKCQLGAEPFIVPAMGSHGGATAEGQLELVAHYGITEATMGCPLLSSMDTVHLGEVEGHVPVWFDRNAFEADAVIPVGRVKPHTDFRGPVDRA